MANKHLAEADVASCGNQAGGCRCDLPVHEDDQPHVCGDGCGGSWLGDFDSWSFEVVSLPTRYVGDLDDLRSVALAVALGLEVPDGTA